MRSHRALTLIEVLASTVLLTMLAATCMPLLQRAMRTLEEDPASLAAPIIDLEQLADEFLADLGRQAVDPTQTAELSWSAHPELAPVQVQLLVGGDESSGNDDARLRGRWLKVSCAACSVLRWIPEPAQEQGQPASDSGESSP